MVVRLSASTFNLNQIFLDPASYMFDLVYYYEMGLSKHQTKI